MIRTRTGSRTGVKRYRIDLAYDGSGFRGFARQPDQRTIQGVLEDALRRFCGVDIAMTVAGRTDAGVHADRQTVHFDTPFAILDLDRARGALTKMCQPGIAVWSVTEVLPSFDARSSAVQRRYRYVLSDAEALHPLLRSVVWHVGHPQLDVDAMNGAAGHLIGEHDFSSFCRRAGDQHLRRRIDRLHIGRRGAEDLTDVVVGVSHDAAVTGRPTGIVDVHVEGPAFCHQMVRSIVGCLLPVGRGTCSADDVPAILAARDRSGVGQVAPPHGLTLVGVTY